MAHQPGMGHGVGPGGKPYNFDTMHQTEQHMQAHMQSPRPEHFPPSSPIFTGTPTMPGPVTPSCTTPPMGTTNIPRYPLRSPTHPVYQGDQRVSPVAARNLMDPALQMHYQYPSYYPGRRPSYSEEQQPITSSPGGTHHLPGYPTGVMSQQMANVPPYPSQNIPKRTQPVKSGTRRNSGLKIEFSPSKGAEMGHEGYPPSSSAYPPQMMRSPAYPAIPQGAPIPGNASDEVKELRRKVVEYIYQNIELVKKRYQHNLQELFFLQHNGNLLDFHVWRHRPTPQWLNYQATHKLEDEIDFYVTSNPMENSQVQNLGNDFIALQHKFYPANRTPGNAQPNKMLSSGSLGIGNSQHSQNPHSSNRVSGNPASGHIDLASSKLFMSKDAGFGPALDRQSSRHNTSNSIQDELANARALALSNSKEDIMLEAKREADIVKRVSELRKEGLWSARRLPKVQEPGRNKSHWDYVLEEMQWLATDFAQERRWKKGVAKKVYVLITRSGFKLKVKNQFTNFPEGNFWIITT